MSYKLQVIDAVNGINFNVRYDRMDKEDKPKVIAKEPGGKEVSERTVYQGQVLGQGSTQRKWVDADGNEYPKGSLTFWYEGEQVQPISQTKVFNITSFEPVQNYTDKYAISSYYELFPCDNGMKKDIDRSLAINTNLYGMRQLWEYLWNNAAIARGEFNVSSKGFMASDGYIRPIQIEGKWGLEIGLFRMEKVFKHLQEKVPQAVQVPVNQPKKTLKRV